MSGIYIIKHQFLLVVESNSQFIKIEYCNKKIPGISEETNGTVGFLGSNLQRYTVMWRVDVESYIVKWLCSGILSTQLWCIFPIEN